MVTDQQLDHYRTYGFVVLAGYLGERETAGLRQELDGALRDGFGAHFHQRPSLGGIEGHYLPMMSRQRTPISLGPGRGRPVLQRGPPAPGRPGAADLYRGHPALRPGRVPLRRRDRVQGGEVRRLPGAADGHQRSPAPASTAPTVSSGPSATPETRAPPRRPGGSRTSSRAPYPMATSPTTTPPIPATTTTGCPPIPRTLSGPGSAGGCASWACSRSQEAGDGVWVNRRHEG
jgi:hypothetical protein